MNNVLRFPNKTPFKFSTPRASKVPEGVVLLTGLALTAWLPTILWCSALQENTPLYLIAATELVSVFIGLVLHQSPPRRPPACVPISKAPPTGQRYPKLPKAA